MIARYGVHCGITSSKELLRDLFHQTDIAAVVDFPGHLKVFWTCVGNACSLSIEEWIQHHTLYPAFLAFAPAERQKQILRSAYGKNAGNIHTRLGVCASFIKPPKYLRVCKQCQLEQRERFGEVYWQRSLQMPGVLFCPRHEESLYISNTRYHPLEKFDFEAAEHAQIVSSLDCAAARENQKLFILLAQNMHLLLQASCDTKMSFTKLSQFYSELAQRHDLRKGTRVDHIGVADKFHAYWKSRCKEVLPTLSKSGPDWLKLLFRKHRKAFHPLCHLLVWQAFNTQDALSTLHFITGLLPLKKPKVILTYLPSSREIKTHRKTWASICKKNPTKGIKWLRNEGNAAATYTWLYRNDREWLQSNSPEKIKARFFCNRVNWEQRDKSLLKNLLVLEAKAGAESVGFRKSKAWYIKNSSLPSILEKHRDKLPLCKKFIDSHAESVEEFQRRRIERAICNLRSENEELQTWKIIRRAGIRKEFLSETLLKFIDKNQGILGNGSSSPDFPPHS